jgi:hypothetical protein
MAIPLNQTARENHVCPRCDAAKGEYCKTPSGRRLTGRTTGIHTERMKCLSKKEKELSIVPILHG